MIQIQERTDGRTQERKDEQTLFYRTLPANAGGPKNWVIYLVSTFLS